MLSESLTNLEVMTNKQAQVYTEEKTGMRSSMFMTACAHCNTQSLLR
jgi:hypothetical protein